MADPQVENPQPEESQPEQPKKEENEVKEQPAQEEKEEQPAQEEKEQQPEEKQEEESKLEQKEEDQVDEDGQHRFHDRWTFWFDKKSANKKASDEDFVEALVKLGAFSTVEEFWRFYFPFLFVTFFPSFFFPQICSISFLENLKKKSLK